MWPKQTVQGDATWVVPGSEPVKIFRVGVMDPLTGTRKRVLYSQDTLYFFFECSDSEIESKTCCPAGTAGPGINNGSFCFPCTSGKFSPHAGSSACASCPSNAVSNDISTNCTCNSGFEGQLITNLTQHCSACVPGIFRNESMTSALLCTGRSIAGRHEYMHALPCRHLLQHELLHMRRLRSG